MQTAQRRRRDRIQMAKDLDITGIFLFMFSCFLTMLGLSLAGAGYQWESKDVAGPLLGAVLFFVVFFVYEAFLCRAPVLMPPRLFKNRHYFVLVINALSASVVYLILYVAWRTVVGKVFSRNSYEIAWHISMLGALFFFSGMALAGFFIAYIPRIRVQCLTAASIAQLSLLYLAAMKTDQYAAITTSVCTLCFALGFIESVTLTGVTYIWEAQDIGLAFGVLSCLCSLGCAFIRVGFASILD
ncbi:putative trichothecene efflux pump [Colletotrichum sublineola]|uniref:Putative trichothecene efflux pump n=1 Tax=Colletotrichum sublineola TaxID=1173701 RepID=A0A066XGX9_COLSU|nr:putative trichothecene efflux pump [Colletotrichum sublineola]